MRKIITYFRWINTPEFDAVVALIIAMIVIGWFQNQ
jgi:hypothetical protein